MSPRDDANSHNVPEGSTVDLVFKVWAPKLNSVTHRIFLLGSLKSMGAWNINTAPEAFPTPDAHTWKVDIRGVPTKSSFEWSWLRSKTDRSDVKWERVVKRNRTVDCFGGVMHTIYGDGEEVFVQSATCVEVSTYRKVDDGQSLVLVGSSQTTGAWDLKKAAKVIESPRQSGYWRAQIAFDTGSTLLFRWAIIRKKDRSLYLMEKENHALYGLQAWLRVVAPWNLPRVFIEDMPICQDPLDLVTGRTDVIVSAKKTRSAAIRKWLKTDKEFSTPTLVPINQVPAPKPRVPPKATPTVTNQEKAKHAFRSLSMKAGNPVPPTSGPTASSGRIPTVQPLENVDEHVKKRSESINRTERPPSSKAGQDKQKPQEFSNVEGVQAIKGKGQTLVARNSGQCEIERSPLIGPDHRSISLTDVRVKEVHGRDLSDSEMSTFFHDSISDFNFLNSVDYHTKKETQNKLSRQNGEEEGDYDLDPFSQRSQKPGSEIDPTEVPRMSSYHTKMARSVNKEDDFNKPHGQSETPSFENKYGCKESLHKFRPRMMLGGNPNDFNENGSVIGDDDEYLEYISLKVDKEEFSVSDYGKNQPTEVEYPFSLDSRPERCSSRLPLGKTECSKSCDIDVASSHKACELWTDNYKGTDRHDGSQDLEDTEHCENTPEVVEKRKIARMLEKQWGCSRGDNSNITDDFLHNLELSSAPTFGPSHTSVCFQPGGNGEWIRPSKEEFRWTRYSNAELANTIVPTEDYIDHRAVARMVEKKWGEHGATKSRSS